MRSQFIRRLFRASRTRALPCQLPSIPNGRANATSSFLLFGAAVLGASVSIGGVSQCATSADASITEAETLWETCNKGGTSVTRTDIYNKLVEDNKAFPENPNLLWRLARAAHDVSNSIPKDDTTLEEKKSKMFEALDWAKKAVSLDDKNGDAHRWMGTIISSSGDFLSTKEQIANSYEIRKHWEKAIELNPSDGVSMALLGRWCYTFANMGWFTRSIAAAVFGTPPSSTYNEALEWYLKSEKARPKQWKMNNAWIGEVYYQMGDMDNAKTWMNDTLALGPTGSDDGEAEKLAKDILAKI